MNWTKGFTPQHYFYISMQEKIYVINIITIIYDTCPKPITWKPYS